MTTMLRHRQTRRQAIVDVPRHSLLEHEKALLSEGFRRVAGVDEAGRGCLAGPVVAGAVILPPGISIDGLTDSKQLTARQRDRFFDIIQDRALSCATGVVGPREIDAINILNASLKAMQMAVDALAVEPDVLLIDGPFTIDHALPQRALIKGDARSLSIAAASVIAKVTRDRAMKELSRDYPAFAFSIHKGYGTAIHRQELLLHGPTPAHRMTFRGVAGRQP